MEKTINSDHKKYRDFMPKAWKLCLILAAVILMVNIYGYISTGHSDRPAMWLCLAVLFISIALRFISERREKGRNS